MTEFSFIGKTGDQTEFVAVVRQNEIVIDTALTIDATNAALSAGPITQNETVTVNGYWSIV